MEINSTVTGSDKYQQESNDRRNYGTKNKNPNSTSLPAFKHHD
jgi:hypothetical protein